MAIKIEMLRCFATVAQSGNLAEAADTLHRTPSAVSMMLKQFEDHIGAPLFETGRKSHLSQLGEMVLIEAERELMHFDRTIAMIEGFARAEHGFVRIAATPSVAIAVLPNILRQFHAERPDVHIDVRDMDSVSVLRELTRERADIGLASMSGAVRDLVAEPLFSDRFGIVCPLDHPLANSADPPTWADLEGCTFIANGLCRQIENAEFKTVLAGSNLMVPNTTSLLAMVQAGVGVTVLPQLAVLGNFHDLSFVPLSDPVAMRRVNIVTRARASHAPAVEAFIAALRDVDYDALSE